MKKTITPEYRNLITFLESHRDQVWIEGEDVCITAKLRELVEAVAKQEGKPPDKWISDFFIPRIAKALARRQDVRASRGIGETKH